MDASDGFPTSSCRVAIGKVVKVVSAVPSLDEIANAPERAADFSESTRSALLARCAAVLAALSAAGRARIEQRSNENQGTNPERLLTVPEVATILGFARGYTYELVRRGEIRALHHGKYWRITPAAVEEFIRKNESSATLDKSLSNMLSRLDDRRTAKASTQSARIGSDRVGEAARGPSGDPQPMGARVLAGS